MPTFFILFVVLGFGLVGLVGYLGYLSAKKRREELAALAAKRGWTWTERDDSWADRFDDAPFGLGHNRQARNILRGTYDGRDMIAFDYVYHTTETSSGPNNTTTTREQSHGFSIIAIGTGARFPHLKVTPEGMVGRFFGRLTNTDIELESEAFNRAFTVNCDDRKFATDVLHPQMMEYLLTLPDLAWSTRNDTVMVVEAGQHSAVQLDASLKAIDGILDRIPDFVWKAAGL
ncbi:DUF3137 domain-containing protein [Nocardioides marmorisolisilvae]|uniref:DUF3137 domain-containing protein n=1 Tax=Nocardioides marmorisolisilvae TaxID=1542737 RepID=A0A3N0DVF8_9ACTN|nr:DUF3137 domain-containing protein [Nocardioides marmorisolisilvae]RNL79476.1 DUF3137 domain-containing protein [Nocardioides marmorisolisilvae]